MKRICLLLFLFNFPVLGIEQEKFHVTPELLMQLRIPIQPSDKSWAGWNYIPSPQDSTKTIRIDRVVQGYAPFIPREAAPYYSAAQVKEIQLGLEKILNPDRYFATQKEHMDYSRSFMDKYVFRKADGE